MLSYHRLAVLPLLALVLWATPASALMISSSDDISRQSSDQPLGDPEQEKEASEIECEESIYLCTILCVVEISPASTMRTDRHDEPIHLPQPVLTGPDHSRAPPA